MSRTGVRKRLEKELGDFNRHDETRTWGAGPEGEDIAGPWEATMMGPTGTPYEYTIFFLRLTFPDTYPFKPPDLVFTTPIWHLGVKRPNGGGCTCPKCGGAGQAICLHMFEDWSPAMGVNKLLQRVCDALKDPQPSEGVWGHAGAQQQKPSGGCHRADA